MRKGPVGQAILALIVGFSPALLAADPCADHVPQQRPQNVGRDIVGQDMDTILERGHMLFAVYEDYRPYRWKAKGTPRGIGDHLAEKLERGAFQLCQRRRKP